MSYLAQGTCLAGRYTIHREIGRGGHSVVYAAHDSQLDTDVAVKLLVPPPATLELARARLRREVLAVRHLTHEHIVPIYDYLTEGPWQFVVMRLVDGQDLEVRVRERGPVPADEAASLAESIASALTLAHQEGILHRDVKPRNILIEKSGKALLTDFGSARILNQGTMTETGGLVGTLAYSAPELMAGHRADARSDVYALGLTLYYALTGRLPAQGSPHLPPGARPRGTTPALRTSDCRSGWMRWSRGRRLPTLRSAFRRRAAWVTHWRRPWRRLSRWPSGMIAAWSAARWTRKGSPSAPAAGPLTSRRITLSSSPPATPGIPANRRSGSWRGSAGRHREPVTARSLRGCSRWLECPARWRIRRSTDSPPGDSVRDRFPSGLPGA